MSHLSCASRDNKLPKMKKAAVTEFWTTVYIFNLEAVVCNITLIPYEC